MVLDAPSQDTIDQIPSWMKEAVRLLEDVAQESTQWSVVYRINAGEIRIVMGGEL